MLSSLTIDGLLSLSDGLWLERRQHVRCLLLSGQAGVFLLLQVGVSQFSILFGPLVGVTVLHRWVLHEVLDEGDRVNLLIGHDVDVHAVVILVLVHRFQVVVPLLIERLLLVVIPWHDVALSLEIESIL